MTERVNFKEARITIEELGLKSPGKLGELGSKATMIYD